MGRKQCLQLIAFVACTPGAPPTAAPISVAPLIATDVPLLYPPPPAAARVLRCQPGAPPAAERAVFELESITLAPMRAGPLVRERPLVAARRRPSDVAGMLSFGDLKACYRWARQGVPDLEADVEVHLNLDPWGRVSQVDVDPDLASAKELAVCVADVAKAAEGPHLPVARETRVSSSLLAGVKQPACIWRAGALAAVLEVAPWLDERAEQAGVDLVAHLRKQPGDRTCVAHAAPLLARVAAGFHQQGVRERNPDALERAIAWYERIISLPALPNATSIDCSSRKPGGS